MELRNVHLQEYGLRDVEVCLCNEISSHLLITFYQNIFWRFAHSDPYLALSFDRLHTNHLGLFGHHLWKEVQLRITVREEKSKADKRSVLILYYYDW